MVIMFSGATLPRREFLVLAGAAMVRPLAWQQNAAITATQGVPMFGLIGKLTAVSGQRDALAAILVEASQAMPGCLVYIVAADSTDADGLWVTEVWDAAASHQASLDLPAVKAAVAKGKPLIAAFGNRVETVPLGGYGLRR
jgi:quinol monooxygenase YgiN